MRSNSTMLHGWLALSLALSAACGSSSDPAGAGADAGNGSDSGQGGSIEAGKTIATQRVCASCHAAPDGTLSGVTTPYPGTQAYAPNLTPDQDTGLGGWTDEQIVAAILDGVDDEGEELCTVMPKFRAAGMTDAEAQDLVAYLRSLAPVKHEVPEKVSCTAAAN